MHETWGRYGQMMADGNVAFIIQFAIANVTAYCSSVRKFSIVPGHSTNSGWTARQCRAGKDLFFCGLVVLLKLFRCTDLGGCLAVDPFGSFWFHFMTFAQRVGIHRHSSIVQAKLVASSF